MTEQNDKSLVVADEQADEQASENETLGGSLGGLQALVLFGLVVVTALVVYAFPTPNNPSIPPVTEAPAEEAATITAAFGNLSDGDEVESPFTVEMVAEGIEVAPSSNGVVEGEGHFHIMVNVPAVEVGEVIPADEQHIHYGDARTETELELEPGEYTLLLQLADGAHTALPYTDEVTITVLEPPSVAFGNLSDGDEVESPFTVEMVAEGIEVAPSGEVVEGEGHFHIMVNVPAVEIGEVIPADEQHIHYGDGRTETDVELEPGEYTLVLQLADGIHTALPYTDEVSITVVEPEVVAVEPTAVPTEEPMDEVATEEPTEEIVTEEPPEEVVTEEPTEEIATEEPTDEPVDSSTQTDDTDVVAAALDAGDIVNGQALFMQVWETSSGPWMCSSCHSVTEDQLRLVGPGLYGIYENDERVTESGTEDIVEYVVQSIVEPQAYIVPGDPAYPDNLMPMNFGELMTEQQLADMTAYLLSLGNPAAE